MLSPDFGLISEAAITSATSYASASTDPSTWECLHPLKFTASVLRPSSHLVQHSRVSCFAVLESPLDRASQTQILTFSLYHPTSASLLPTALLVQAPAAVKTTLSTGSFSVAAFARSIVFYFVNSVLSKIKQLLSAVSRAILFFLQQLPPFHARALFTSTDLPIDNAPHPCSPMSLSPQRPSDLPG